MLGVDVENQRVLWSKGDREDPFSQGYNCVKTHALTKLQDDPDLVRRPLMRRGGDFTEVTWEAAFAEIAERTKALRARHGANSLASYFGNATIHHPGLVMYGLAFAASLGSTNVFATSSIDHAPKLLSSGLLFGDQGAIPVPDVERTDFLVIMGANPVASGGSLLTAPGMSRRIKAIRARGGKVVVIDPRYTETAKVASQHIALKPSTDAHLLFALLHVAFDEGLVRLRNVAPYVHAKQVEQVRQLARKYSPARVTETTGVAAEVIVQLARDFFSAERAVCYGRVGTSLQRFGSLASWLVDVLNILSGNLDRPGGAMFPAGVVPPLLLNDTYDGDRPPYGKWHSRVRGLPEIGGILPAVTLAEEILTPGAGQIRGMFIVSGNPASSIPNTHRTAEAFRHLELLVSIDVYVNETSRFADFILPTPPTVQQSAFPLFVVPYMVRNYARYASPALRLEEGRYADWQICQQLAARINDTDVETLEERMIGDLIDVHLARHPLGAQVSHEAARAALGDEPGPDRYYDLLLRTSPHGDCFGQVPGGINLETLKAHPHGIDLGPVSDGRIPAVLKTPDRHIDLAPAIIVADEPRLDAYAPDDEFVLIGRRHARSVNSWMNNLHFLVKGKNACQLLVNPADAERLDVATGDRVRVSSRERVIEVAVEVSDTMMPGVVCLPHGYGQNKPGIKLSLAATLDSANFNDISDETDLDVPSVTPALGSVSVRLEKVARRAGVAVGS